MRMSVYITRAGEFWCQHELLASIMDDSYCLVTITIYGPSPLSQVQIVRLIRATGNQCLRSRRQHCDCHHL